MLVKMIRKFATPAEIRKLQRWILDLQATGTLRPNLNGPARFSVPLGAIEQPKTIARFSRDLRAKFKLSSTCLDLTDLAAVNRTKATPSFVGMQTEGGAVRPHIDTNTGTYWQLRCTLLVSKPESGGRLILADEEYEMEEGDVYCFLSNNTIHGTTVVKGSKPRMACSLGFLVSQSFTLK